MAAKAKKPSPKKQSKKLEVVICTKKVTEPLAVTKRRRTEVVVTAPETPQKLVRRSRALRDKVIDAEAGPDIGYQALDYPSMPNVQWAYIPPSPPARQLELPQKVVEPRSNVRTEGPVSEKAQRALGVDSWGRPIHAESPALLERHKVVDENYHSVAAAAWRELRQRLKEILQKFSRPATSK